MFVPLVPDELPYPLFSDAQEFVQPLCVHVLHYAIVAPHQLVHQLREPHLHQHLHLWRFHVPRQVVRRVNVLPCCLLVLLYGAVPEERAFHVLIGLPHDRRRPDIYVVHSGQVAVVPEVLPACPAVLLEVRLGFLSRF